jgi:dihydroorotate dehydrogenase (NAD+) catalytic subunit
MANLQVSLGKLTLKNPILSASGTFGAGQEIAEFYDTRILGGVVCKSVMLSEKQGNPPPRIAETASGMLNAIGLTNMGIEAFLANDLPKLRALADKVIVNIAGESMDEYVELAKILSGEDGIDALELNISCPNVRKGGLSFSTDPTCVSELVASVRKHTGLFLITKLTPNVTAIGPYVKAAIEAGSDAISLVNTFLATAIDWRTRRPLLANVTGGLSGPAIKPIALRFVYEAARLSSVPIIGIGGIMSADDVLEYMVAGASAVEVGTANFLNPTICREILEDVGKKLDEEGIERIADIIGTLAT